MFSLELILMYTLFFLLGSVFTTILLSHFYELKAVEEEERSVNNRGDQTNGLSVIKNLSTKRFFKGIASIILVILVMVFFVLSYEFDLFKNDSLVSFIVLGVFGFYVLVMEKTIISIRIPIFKMWKDGAPKRKENRQKRKTKREEKKLKKKQSVVSDSKSVSETPTVVVPQAPEVKVIKQENGEVHRYVEEPPIDEAIKEWHKG